MLTPFPVLTQGQLVLVQLLKCQLLMLLCQPLELVPDEVFCLRELCFGWFLELHRCSKLASAILLRSATAKSNCRQLQTIFSNSRYFADQSLAVIVAVACACISGIASSFALTDSTNERRHYQLHLRMEQASELDKWLAPSTTLCIVCLSLSPFLRLPRSSSLSLYVSIRVGESVGLADLPITSLSRRGHCIHWMPTFEKCTIRPEVADLWRSRHMTSLAYREKSSQGFLTGTVVHGSCSEDGRAMSNPATKMSKAGP